ncbi:MAG TPA: hypothetical protein VMV06_05325 [Acidimicrobiales bacterium]|nr:hypothetical protein [Acidimicrobiales bacterium]
MIATVLSLVAVAMLVGILLGTTSHSGGNADTSVSNAPGVAQSDSLAAQQALSTALSSATAAASSVGGLGSVDLSTLSASDPSITFVSGPSANASTVSVAVTADPTGGGGGSVTLADRSSNGTCWLVWSPTGGATWYGAQTGLADCAAPAIGSAPPPGPVSSSAIGWQQGGFPPA